MAEVIWHSVNQGTADGNANKMLHVIRFLSKRQKSKLDGYKATCNAFNSQEDKLIFLVKEASAFFQRQNVDRSVKLRQHFSRVESLFTVLSTLVLDSGSPTANRTFCDIVSKEQTDGQKGYLRLKIMVNHFNHKQSTTATNMYALNKIVDFAGKIGQIQSLDDFFGDLDEHLSASPQEKRDLYRKLSNAYRKSGDLDKDIEFAVKYLSAFQDNQTKDTSSNDFARDTVVRALQRMDGKLCSRIFDLKIVQQLQKTEKALFDFLKVVIFEDVAAYLDFYAKNKKFVDEEIKVDNEKAMESMRIYSLCDLASKKDVISYEDVVESLKIKADSADEKSDEVEKFVLKAISSGLLDARIDQHDGVIVVHASSRRYLDKDQWKNMLRKLQQWKRETVTVMNTLEGKMGAKQRDGRHQARGGGGSRR
eukprot:g2922.t1